MSLGAKLLCKHIQVIGYTHAKAATELGVSPAAMHYWTTARQRPAAFERELIDRWSGGKVPAESWLTEEERERLATISEPEPIPESGPSHPPPERKNGTEG